MGLARGRVVLTPGEPDAGWSFPKYLSKLLAFLSCWPSQGLAEAPSAGQLPSFIPKPPLWWQHEWFVWLR